MQAKANGLGWADHLDWMEGLGPADPADRVVPASPGRIRRILPGLAAAVAVTVAATILSHAPLWPFTTASGRHPLDPILLAVVLGMLMGNLGRWETACKAGTSFAVKQVLPIGVILLGARLDFRDLVAVGATGILLSCLQVIAALVLFAGLIRWWKLPLREGLLLGVGTAICGGTAIVAMAPVIRAKENEIAVSVATVTLLGLIAMFVLPALAALTGLDARAFGIWAGLTIHQTPQVIAAGFAHSVEAGETATIIKLARICLLAPVVLAAGLWWRSRGEATADSRPWWRLFPLFVLGFAGLALWRTLGLLPAVDVHWEASRLLPEYTGTLDLPGILGAISAFLLTVAMAGVGMETRVTGLHRSSLRAILVAGLAAVLLGALALMAARAVA